MVAPAEGLQAAVRAIGKEDKEFEKATKHTAQHLLVAAGGVGWSQATFHASTAATWGQRALHDTAHHGAHVGVETAVGKGVEHVVADHD